VPGRGSEVIEFERAEREAGVVGGIDEEGPVEAGCQGATGRKLEELVRSCRSRVLRRWQA